MNYQEPLLAFFLQIKDKFELCIDDYLLFAKSLESNFELRTEEDLLRLCKLLWLRSSNPKQLNIFEESFRLFYADMESNSKSEGENLSNEDKDIPMSPKYEDNDSAEKKGEKSSLSTDSKKEAQADNMFYLNSNGGQNDEEAIKIQEEELKAFSFDFGKNNFFPLEKKVSDLVWRQYQNNFQQTNNSEIDINACVNEFSKKGFLLNFFYEKQSVDTTKLVVIIDIGNSMTAFEYLSEQIVSTLEAQCIDNEVFYFNNLPNFLQPKLYDDRISWNLFCKKYLQDNQLLIISDAGATRGNYSGDRIKATDKFVRDIKNNTKRVAWLNPMPQKRWKNNSAMYIAKMIPMFEMSVQGLNNVSKVLRGKIK